jgi:hypothetical protein
VKLSCICRIELDGVTAIVIGLVLRNAKKPAEEYPTITDLSYCAGLGANLACFDLY